MIRLAALIYIFVGVTLAGSLIVAALTMNMFDTRSIVIAAVIGFVAALPVAWVLARKLREE